MDETEIKTRQGLILENVLAAALTRAGLSYDQDVQYDAACEKPDFLIPNLAKPKFMVEVHQTEARDSFRMKILRAFTAVTESKAHFGNELVSVNVLFGDPENELPASNVKSMCGIFDLNIIPRRDASKPNAIQKMEEFALSLAKKEDKKTEAAGKEVVKSHPSGVDELADLIKNKILGKNARPELNDLWDLERTRIKSLGKPPKAGDPTYYKRCMLWALFLNDTDFAELQKKKDPALCSDSVKKQLLATKLATITEELDGDCYTLNPDFAAFLKDPNCLNLRLICKNVLDTVPAMKWFFEDVRDAERRLKMANEFVEILINGRLALSNAIQLSLGSDDHLGIKHCRCWIAESLCLTAGVSQNSFNKRMVQTDRDPENYQYPFNNITGKFQRLMGCPEHFEKYAVFAVEVFEEFLESQAESLDKLFVDVNCLADKILASRLDGVVKLQRLSPLDLIVAAECTSLGLAMSAIKVESIAYDLAGGKGRLGKYNAFEVCKGSQKSICVSVAVHDNNGDHKSKEWGARRLATLYRMEKGKIRKSEYQEGIFVLDGEWKDKDVARLHRSGWNHVVRLADLEKTLQSVFGISTPKAKTAQIIPIPLPEEEDLAMAAETDAPPKLKRVNRK